MKVMTLLPDEISQKSKRLSKYKGICALNPKILLQIHMVSTLKLTVKVSRFMFLLQFHAEQIEVLNIFLDLHPPESVTSLSPYFYL